jgi:hypothetical protein
MMPGYPAGKYCPHCLLPYNISSGVKAGGWFGYQYQGSNSLQLSTPIDHTNGACISFIDIYLYYVEGTIFM